MAGRDSQTTIVLRRTSPLGRKSDKEPPAHRTVPGRGLVDLGATDHDFALALSQSHNAIDARGH